MVGKEDAELEDCNRNVGSSEDGVLMQGVVECCIMVKEKNREDRELVASCGGRWSVFGDGVF
jgi:hypothetical protein